MHDMALLISQNANIINKHNVDPYIIEHNIERKTINDIFSTNRTATISRYFQHTTITNNGVSKIIPLPKFSPKNFERNQKSVTVIDNLHIPEAILTTVSLGNLY